jgi:hypothetical protein
MNEHDFNRRNPSSAYDAPPLTHVSNDGALSIRFQEGARVQIPGGPNRSTQSIFSLALWGSLELGGQPIRCTGIVPGVSLRIASGTAEARDDEHAIALAAQAWSAVYPRLVKWLIDGPTSAVLNMPMRGGLEIQFAKEGHTTLRPGVMQIEVEHGNAFAASYAASRARRPLIEQAPDAREPRITIEKGALPALIRLAMEKTIRADDPLYERLPVPVRYRATGAIDAWRQVRDAAGRSGADLSHRLPLFPVGALLDNFHKYLEAWTRGNPSSIDGPAEMGHAHRSLVWQIFTACQGALYEPTPPLHRLLDAAYIADDVPVGLIKPPADAMCIIPDPSWWGRKEGVEAIALFHRKLDSDGSPHESLGCVTWSQFAERGERHVRMQVMEFSLSDPNVTIRRLFDTTEAALDDPDEIAASAATRRYWEGVLDYAIKMLLYLTVRDANVVHDRAHTDAPREFSGLGKRKRAERLAQIEMLYDRHLVGPAILDAESIASIPTDDEHHEVRGHWRRPHFRMQPHGPHSSLRKLAFIGPTLVRPDRLGL